MPRRPKKTVTRRKKYVQQPLFCDPEFLGRVLRRVYPDLMSCVDRVVCVADDPKTPSTVWAAVQDLELLTRRDAKRFSRCRRGKRLLRNADPCPGKTAKADPLTSPLLASPSEAPGLPVRSEEPCVGCGLMYPDCTCA